jgi:hypothetical protein
MTVWSVLTSWRRARPVVVGWILAGVLVLSEPAARQVAEATVDPSLVNQASAIELVFTEYAITPGEPVGLAGLTRLRLVNGGIRRHNLVLLVDGAEVASPEVRPGDTVEWDVPLARAGQYIFWCGEYRHLEKGMAGTLTVE